MKFISPRGLSIATLVLALLTGSSSLVAADSAYGDNHGPAPMKYGYVVYSQLSDLAPASANAGLHLLMAKKYSAAADSLQQQYMLHPDSLAIYAGLAQVSPRLVNAEIAKDNDVPVDKLPDLDKFKLATSLYYSWSIQPFGPRKAMIQKSERMLHDLWLKSKSTIVGLMFDETVITSGPDRDPSLMNFHVFDLMDEMIDSLGGQAVRDEYEQAKLQNWDAQPPAFARVPVANRRALLAVVCSRGSFFKERVGTVKVVNGVGVNVWRPLAPEQIAAQQYFDTWVSDLYKGLGIHPLNGKLTE